MPAFNLESEPNERLNAIPQEPDEVNSPPPNSNELNAIPQEQNEELPSTGW